MLTNDKRREIAAKMRAAHKEITVDCFLAGLMGTGCHEVESCGECVLIVLDRLADLVWPDGDTHQVEQDSVLGYCPHCGGSAWMGVTTPNKLFYVECAENKCVMTRPVETSDEAIAIWNTRYIEYEPKAVETWAG